MFGRFSSVVMVPPWSRWVVVSIYCSKPAISTASLFRVGVGGGTRHKTPAPRSRDRPLAMGTLTWTPACLFPRESSERVPCPLSVL